MARGAFGGKGGCVRVCGVGNVDVGNMGPWIASPKRPASCFPSCNKVPPQAENAYDARRCKELVREDDESRHLTWIFGAERYQWWNRER